MDELDKMINEKANALVEKNKKPVQLEDLQEKFLEKQVQEGKTISQITEDFAKAKTTSDIMRNEDGQYDKLHKELAQEQKETLKESFKQDKVEQQAKTLSAKHEKAEAFYVSFRPILEFDFSPLIHKKVKEELPPKTYKDRSYGIPLMLLMLALFVVPYCAFSIILALFNGVNAIFEAIATFGKIARVIATSVFIMIILGLVVYGALLGIDAIFGTTIVSTLGL